MAPNLQTPVAPTFFWIAAITATTLIATIAGLQIWLIAKTGWPDAYGFHCHGRGCMMRELYHSPALLRRGGGHEIALFAALWSLPALMLILSVFTWTRRRRGATGG